MWLGTAFLGALLLATGLVLIVRSIADGGEQEARRLNLVLAGCLPVFLAGLYDDYRPARTSGLIRQLVAVLHGRVTSGVVKAAAILASALAVAWALHGRGLRLGLGTAVIAGAANLWNLLDVVPGRSLKFFLPAVATLGLAAGGTAYPQLAATAFVVGAAALAIDLLEIAMLGDSGSNVLGFIIGVGLFLAVPTWGLALCLAALLGLHVLAETVTLTRLIRDAPPLRWFDDLGRRPVASTREGAGGSNGAVPPGS